MFNEIVHLNEGYLHGKSLRPPMCVQRRYVTPYICPKKSSKTLAGNFRSAYKFPPLYVPDAVLFINTVGSNFT